MIYLCIAQFVAYLRSVALFHLLTLAVLESGAAVTHLAALAPVGPT